MNENPKKRNLKTLWIVLPLIIIIPMILLGGIWAYFQISGQVDEDNRVSFLASHLVSDSTIQSVREEYGQLIFTVDENFGWSSNFQSWEIRENGVIFYYKYWNDTGEYDYYNFQKSSLVVEDINTISGSLNSNIKNSDFYKCDTVGINKFFRIPVANAIEIDNCVNSCIDAGGVTVRVNNCNYSEPCFHVGRSGECEQYAQIKSFIDSLNSILNSKGVLEVGDNSFHIEALKPLS